MFKFHETKNIFMSSAQNSFTAPNKQIGNRTHSINNKSVVII